MSNVRLADIKDAEKTLLKAMLDNPQISMAELARQLIKSPPFDRFMASSLRMMLAEVRRKNSEKFKVDLKATELGKIPATAKPPVKSSAKTPPIIKVDEFKDDGDKGEIRKTVTKRIKTLEDLVRVCEIDLDIWEVERWSCNKWESFYHNQDRTDHEIVPLYQVKASLKKNHSRIIAKGIYEDLIEDAKRYRPKYVKIKYPKVIGTLLEVDMLDFHLGRRTWEEESGEEGSLERAEKDFMFCIDEILSQAAGYPIERILFPVGNDFFNADNGLGTTTAGTRQKEDPIWRRTYRFGRELLVKAIDKLSLIAPVDVMVIPGNHDMERAYYLGDGLACWYHNNPNVSIDNGPRKRKYYEHGSCLIGFAHGKTEKMNDLPTLMTTEEPQKFARTKFHEFHLGDKHHEKKINWVSIQENQGVVVRILRSLAIPDEWSVDNGYIGSQRSAEGFIWDKDKGMRAHLFVNL